MKESPASRIPAPGPRNKPCEPGTSAFDTPGACWIIELIDVIAIAAIARPIAVGVSLAVMEVKSKMMNSPAAMPRQAPSTPVSTAVATTKFTHLEKYSRVHGVTMQEINKGPNTTATAHRNGPVRIKPAISDKPVRQRYKMNRANITVSIRSTAATVAKIG